MTIHLDSPEVVRFFETLTENGNVVFVTGCARSGTSLLHRCLSSLHAPEFLWSENSLLTLYKRGAEPGGNIILKRTSACHTTLHLIPKGVKVVHIVRHPADVLTSKVRQKPGYYVTPQRWIAETQAFWQMKKHRPADRLVVVRYEDLVSDPDAVQRRLSKSLSLRFDHSFTDYTIRNHLDEKIDRFTKQLRIWEPIERGRTFKNRSNEEKQRRLEDLRDALQPMLGLYCNEFNYDIPGEPTGNT